MEFSIGDVLPLGAQACKPSVRIDPVAAEHFSGRGNRVENRFAAPS